MQSQDTASVKRATEDGPQVARLGGGTNLEGACAYNERLALSLIRRSGPLAKAQLSRLTGLSAQTMTTMIKRLEAGRLVRAGKPVRRGTVGQPSVPYSLEPDAVFSLGLKIGRRSMELVLCDFLGAVRARETQLYPWPMPGAALDFAEGAAPRLISTLPTGLQKRVIGAGVAMPFEIWDWADLIHADPGALESWRGFDPERSLSARLGLPVIASNDATAACAAEIFHASGTQPLNFLYLFIGWFAGGGIALDGTLFPGPRGNAGALGSMPVSGPNGKTEPLLNIASLAALERRLLAQGRDAGIALDAGRDWDSADPVFAGWLDDASGAIAQAAAASAAVVDFEALCIDGAMPAAFKSRLTASVREKFDRLDRRGLSPLDIVEGRVGPNARSMGAAILPILANYSRDREVLFKSVEAAGTSG